MTKLEYRAYLLSEHWQAVRRGALWRAQNRCQSPICRYHWVRGLTDSEITECVPHGDYRLDVHHLTYERLGAELPDDLLVLCRDCHELIHGLRIIEVEDEDEDLKKSSYAAIYAWLRGRAA